MEKPVRDVTAPGPHATLKATVNVTTSRVTLASVDRSKTA